MKKIPVIFHNLKGYDGHLIMQEIGKFDQKIRVIPKNMETYMSFMIGQNLRFIDSFSFMNESLEELVKNLPDDGFKYLSQNFDGEKLKLLKRKGVYPYDYMDNFNRFDEKKLPSKENFNSHSSVKLNVSVK